MRDRRTSLISGFVAILVGAWVSPAGSAIAPEWVPRWRSDLAFVADTLPKVHADLFHKIAPQRWRAQLDSLSERLPTLDHHEVTVELARIVALIGDGHTRLTFPFDSAASFFTGHSTTAPPLVLGLVFRHLPLRLRLFSDGVYVVRAGRGHDDLLGGKVVELGRLPIAAAIAAVEPVVHRDNDRQLADLLPYSLVVPEILHARGVTSEVGRVRVVVETVRGRRSAVLEPAPLGIPLVWRDARTSGSPPQAERHPEQRHWFERIAGTRALYARYREVLDDPRESVAAFADSLFDTLAESDAERLILDLRGNVGGNGFLNRPLLHGVIAARELREPGALIVLADRGTFSAAMMLLAQLETHTPAVIVGEKSGGDPNSYGDSRRVRLPATGLTIRASTLYWQMTDPRDPRDGITPHLPVDPTFEDWRARRDPVLETALGILGPAGDPAGTWQGEIGVMHQRIAVTLAIERAGAGWRGRLNAPELGVEDEPLREVGFADGTLRFGRPGSRAASDFRGLVTAQWMVGTVPFQGSTLPFVLRRAGTPPSAHRGP